MRALCLWAVAIFACTALPGFARAEYRVIWFSNAKIFPGGELDPSFLGDFDGDKQLELLVGGTDGKVFIIDAMTGIEEFQFQSGSQPAQFLSVMDLDGDRTPEAISLSWQGTLQVVDWVSGSNVPQAAADASSESHSMSGPVPNPFNPRTEIPFRITTAGEIEIRIYDAAGRLVRSLARQHVQPGQHREFWDGLDDAGRSVASGTYFVQLEIDGSAVASRKAIVLR